MHPHDTVYIVKTIIDTTVQHWLFENIDRFHNFYSGAFWGMFSAIGILFIAAVSIVLTIQFVVTKGEIDNRVSVRMKGFQKQLDTALTAFKEDKNKFMAGLREEQEKVMTEIRQIEKDISSELALIKGTSQVRMADEDYNSWSKEKPSHSFLITSMRHALEANKFLQQKSSSSPEWGLFEKDFTKIVIAIYITLQGYPGTLGKIVFPPEFSFVKMLEAIDESLKINPNGHIAGWKSALDNMYQADVGRP